MMEKFIEQKVEKLAYLAMVIECANKIGRDVNAQIHYNCKHITELWELAIKGVVKEEDYNEFKDLMMKIRILQDEARLLIVDIKRKAEEEMENV